MLTSALSRRYLPELHDVHPEAVGALSELMGALPEPARAVAAVLVVPNYRHTSPIDQDRAFCDWLQRTGRDVVLHGYAHAAPETPWNRLWYGSANDAEFSRLARPDAVRAIAAGADLVVSATGRVPRWFCAPRWRYSRGTRAALRDAKLAGWMLRDRLERADGLRLTMPAVWFDDGPRRWRRAGARLVRRRRVAGLLGSGAPFRLALHPRDAAAPEIRREIDELVSRLTGDGWTPVSLSDAVAAVGAHHTIRSGPPGGGAKGAR